jgi:hypothetical protein
LSLVPPAATQKIYLPVPGNGFRLFLDDWYKVRKTAMIVPHDTWSAELDALLPPILDKAFPVEYDNA